MVPEGVAWARYPDGYDVWLGDGSIKQVRARPLPATGRTHGTAPPAQWSPAQPARGILFFWADRAMACLLCCQVGEDELILGKTWKLNAERNNGRAAMMGITGMIIHEALTGNPVFPIGESM